MHRTQKSLVVYYSRTGENYAVGDIAEGNTAIVAKMIARKTGADLFEIRTVKEYAADYTECTEEAKRELRDDARPEIVGDVADFAQYGTVYVGYPIWWGVPPMGVFTFIEKHDWTGKTVRPAVRSKRAAPSSPSSFCMARLWAGCETCNAFAAAVKDPHRSISAIPRRR